MATKKPAAPAKGTDATKPAKTTGKSADKSAAKTSAKTAAKATAPAAAKERAVSELIADLAGKTGLSKAQTKELLDAHAELLISELQTIGSVQIAGIGKFKMGERAERQGRNPATGEAMTIKAAKTVRFAGGKKFKEGFQ